MASLTGPAKNVVRWLVQLVARFVVVSYLQASLEMRGTVRHGALRSPEVRDRRSEGLQLPSFELPCRGTGLEAEQRGLRSASVGARETQGGTHESGQGLVEYGLIIGLGAVAVVVAMLFLADSLENVFTRSGESAQVFTPPVVRCEASYQGVCIPPAPPDLDCSDLEELGIPLPVRVSGGDPHGLDPDGDGFGC